MHELFAQVGLRKELIAFIEQDLGIKTIRQFKHVSLDSIFEDLQKRFVYDIPAKEKLVLKELEKQGGKLQESVRVDFRQSIEGLIKKFNIPHTLLAKLPSEDMTIGDFKYFLTMLDDSGGDGDGGDNEDDDDEDGEAASKKPVKKEEKKEEKPKEKKPMDKEEIREKILVKKLNDYFSKIVDSSEDPYSVTDPLKVYALLLVELLRCHLFWFVWIIRWFIFFFIFEFLSLSSLKFYFLLFLTC